MVYNYSMQRPSVGKIPKSSELQGSLQKAAEDLYALAYLTVRDSMRAESILQEVLLLGLERQWIAQALSASGEITHLEFREDLLREVWLRAKGSVHSGGPGGDLRLSESSQPFYRLDLQARAALYLRSRMRLSLGEIARVLGLADEEIAFALLESARMQILGRELSLNQDDDVGSGYDV